MTDLEKFLELYKSFGIELWVDKVITYLHSQFNEKEVLVIQLSDACFHVFELPAAGSLIMFDLDGKFIEQVFYS